LENLGLKRSIHPVTLAACCIKFAECLDDDEHTFDDISVACGITKVTLKNTFRELYPNRYQFIPKVHNLKKRVQDLQNTC